MSAVKRIGVGPVSKGTRHEVWSIDGALELRVVDCICATGVLHREPIAAKDVDQYIDEFDDEGEQS